MESLTGLEGGEGFRYVLARTDFRLVWFAQLASQAADKFVMFSLIILAYNLGGANTTVAVTLLSYTLPALFLPPFPGGLRRPPQPPADDGLDQSRPGVPSSC